MAKKFKNTKTKKEVKKTPKKSPRNYRNIPEHLNKDEVVFFVGVLAILMAMLVISLDLYSNLLSQKSLESQKGQVINKIVFWQNELKTHPNYRDGYFSLALLNYQLRSLDEARKNLDKALEIDPNFEEGRELEKILNSK